MLISDLARQYIKSTTSKGTIRETKGVERLVSSIRDLTAGNVFEGTVNSIKGGQVVLGLSNGTELAARLDADMQLVEGQSMFFQVKSNTGDAIAIRPYTVDGAGVNLTLLQALKAANLPASERFLNMANAMMQEKMPIDRNSMMQMARILMANPEMSVNTLVQMKKLNLPITKEMVAQFENYVDNNSAVHKALDQFILELPSLMEGKDLSLEQAKELDSELLQILADGIAEIDESLAEPYHSVESSSASAIWIGAKETHDMTGMQNRFETSASESEDVTGLQRGVESGQANVIPTDSVQVSAEVKDAVVRLLQGKFGNFSVTTEDSFAQVLQKLAAFLQKGEGISKDDLQKLFSSKEMRHFLREVLEKQMYLTPEDTAEADNIQHLYERLESKAQSISQLLANAGLQETSVAQNVADAHANVEFMNQLNQTFTYIQLPLKLSGQTASGQLYVYTKKRDLGDPEKELSAFLHLDLDHLGTTDVSVRLRKKEVDTRFYMDNDTAYELLQRYMSILEESLRLKGYNCKVYVENEGRSVDFLEDFLKKDMPSAGALHRYSFDVRA